MTSAFRTLSENMTRFLANEISGAEIVSAIDRFVSDDKVYELPEDACKKVLKLQDEVAFYVADKDMRKEHESYFGDDRLRNIISKFLKA